MKFIKEMIVKKGQSTGAPARALSEGHTPHDAPIDEFILQLTNGTSDEIDLTPPPGRAGAKSARKASATVLKLTEAEMAPEGVPTDTTPVQPQAQPPKRYAKTAPPAPVREFDDDFEDEAYQYDDDIDQIDQNVDLHADELYDEDPDDPFADAPKRRTSGSSRRELAKERVTSRAKSRQLAEQSKKPWHMDDDDDDDFDDYDEDDDIEAVAAPVSVPTPSAGRSGRQAGRVKTRLLGFHHSDGSASDVFDETKNATQQSQATFPVGWIVVVEGPGRGACYTLFDGVSQIGRGEDQAITLDFGDTTISRSNHAAVAYDSEQHKFFLGHGGKSNLVRLNNRPVLSTEELGAADLIRLGETTLRFIPLCDDEFNWDSNEQGESGHASGV